MTDFDRHIAFLELANLVEGLQNAMEQERIRVHVAGCGRCAADLAWLERVIGLMRNDDSIDPPAPVVARAVGLFGSRRPAETPTLRQRLYAALRFDSARTNAAPALRSRALLERQLMFNAEGFDLDLRIRPEGRLWQISGQVFGCEGSGQIELDGPSGLTRTDLNKQYEFRLPPIPAGNYSMTVRLEQIDVQITGLEIGS